MCRSIKVLRKPGEVPTAEEVSAAALQFVRKISGFQKPSRLNQAAFDRAVLEISESSQRLLRSLEKPRLSTSLKKGLRETHACTNYESPR